MADIREEQVEALEVLLDYSPKLLRGMKNVIEELKGNRQPDTDEYLMSVINGMNWEIEVLNGTMDLINEDAPRVDKEEANRMFVKFGEVFSRKDDREIAAVLETELHPFFEKFEQYAGEIVGKR